MAPLGQSEAFTSPAPGLELCRPGSHTSDGLEGDLLTCSAGHCTSSLVPPKNHIQHICYMMFGFFYYSKENTLLLYIKAAPCNFYKQYAFCMFLKTVIVS